MFHGVGPIPEGMSAAVALRVKQYRADHAAIAERLRSLVDRFVRARGYQPPYWQMVPLARQAKHELEGERGLDSRRRYSTNSSTPKRSGVWKLP
jgi:hypothetical protein